MSKHYLRITYYTTFSLLQFFTLIYFIVFKEIKEPQLYLTVLFISTNTLICRYSKESHWIIQYILPLLLFIIWYLSLLPIFAMF